MKQLFLPLCIFTLLVTSCSKDNDTIQPPVTQNTPDLTGSYQIAKVILTEGTQQQDITAEAFEACQRDDVRTLNSDNTYVIVDDGDQCANSYSGTWSMKSATEVNINDIWYTITRFDEKQLELTINRGNSRVYTEIWNRK